MNIRILVIDDDARARELLQIVVEAQGWEFLGAGTAGEGLKAAERHKPDAIVLDVVLPDMKGWDVCRRLREIEAVAKTPILLVSGKHKDSEDIVKGLKSGADDYLPKPLRPALLVEKIKTVVRPLPKGV